MKPVLILVLTLATGEVEESPGPAHECRYVEGLIAGAILAGGALVRDDGAEVATAHCREPAAFVEALTYSEGECE